MSAPSTANIEINQKSDFQVTIYVVNSSALPADLSNYSVAAKYKKEYFTPDAQANSFTASITNEANGEISLSLTPAQTANLQIQQKYVYDVTLTNTSTDFKSRILQGNIIVSPGVT